MLLSLVSRRSLEVDSRDAYGFVLRPQHVQRYREYASIYKEEEEERSDKWKIFLEQQAISDEPLSIEDEVAESFPAGITKTSENGVERSWEGYYSRQKSESDSQTERDPEEQVQLPEESEEEVQLSKVPVQHSEQPEKEVHASKEPRKEKNCREQESEEQLPEEPEKEEQHCKHEKEEQLSRDPEKEQHLSKDTELRGFQTWSSIRPSLAAIEHMMSLRVKSTMDMKGEQGYVKKGHLPSIKETESSKVEYEGAADKEIGCNGASDESSNASREEKSAIHSFPESLFPWKEELEFLVRGGVPKDLRGEVWQAFVGVKARRVERYYEKLLAQENSTNESKDPADSTGAFRKWRKQIEKDIPRTFPGHPALNEHGRDSLRRLLLAYARHNPSVGYCQAMNFFAGLLLLLMPEENAFWTLVGIIDEYFEGYYTEEMIESQVDQLVFEELMRERFPKLVNHLDYLGVQVTWISGPWFLSIFVNMLPWESVLRVWDVLLYEGNRVMLFRTALALMDLYGPALVTTEDAGDAITLLQSLAGSTFDSSQLVLTACMGFLAVTEAKLQELREKHRTSVLVVVQERSRGAKVWKDSKGIASKLYSFKHDKGALVEEKRTSDEDKPQSEACSSNLEDLQNGINIDTEVDSLPDLQEQVVWLKVELCRLLEEKRSAILRAEELETALMEVVSQDNRRELTAKIEQLEQEVAVLRQALTDKKEQESAMLQVLLRVEQEQRIAGEARLTAEQDASAQKHALNELQGKYEKAMATVAQMEKRVVMAESMLEATLNYESGQAKALSSPRLGRTTSSQVESPRRKISLFGWRDRNKGRPSTEELGEKMASPGSGLQ